MVPRVRRFSVLIEKILGGVFLVGFFSFLFFGNAGVASAAVNPPRAPTSTAILSAQSVSYTWNTSTAGGTETFWVVRSSLNGTATPVVASTTAPTSTVLTYTFTGLATNTLYTFDVAGSDGSASSTMVTSSPVYTAAGAASVPALGSLSTSTLFITMATDTNPAANTTYIVRDTAPLVGAKYLQADGTWGTASTSLSWANLGSGSATTTRGFTTNTLHTISIAAVNGDHTNTTSFSAGVSNYTMAAVPNAVTLSSTGAQNLLITMATDTNPASLTTYIVRDSNASVGAKYLQADGTWGTASTSLSWANLGSGSATTTTGLATGTQHTISLAAVNNDHTATSSFGTAATLYGSPTAPGTPTLTAVSPLVLAITVDAGTNPTANTTFVVRDTVSSTQTQYLQTDATWSTATATLTWAQVGSGAAKNTTGLTANTNHIISVAAVNGDSTATSTYSSTASKYTSTNAPTAVLYTTVGQTSIVVSWTGDGTSYYVTSLVDSSNSGWISDTTYTKSGLACSARYTFMVKARNGDGVETSNTVGSQVTTAACDGSGAGVVGGGGGGGGAVVVTPAVSGKTPAIVVLPVSASPVAVSRQEEKVARFNFNVALKSGSTGANVQQLQTLLKELGFFTYPRFTNNFGSVTRAAVIAYQKANDLPATGQLDAATRSALQSETTNQVAAPAAPASSVGFKFTSTLRLGSVGEQVRQLQQKLKDLGFFTYPTITGTFGPVTRDAVVKFQKAHGLSPFPGFVGPGTRSALNSL